MYRRGLLIGNEELGMLMVVEQEAPRFSQWHPAFAPAGTSASVSTGTPVADIEVAVATPGVVPGLTEDEIAGQLAPEPRLDELESSFRRSLIMAGGAAGLAGILLVGMFTRQALAPVRGLTGAARRLGKGDLSYRVPENHHDEVGQLAKTFNEMAAGLETAAAQRKAMTADIAHELRTPLTNIKGYLEAIKDGVVEPDPATINVIYDQTVHLSRLVEDLRLLAIADAGRLRLDLQPERLDLLAEDAVTAFRPRATERRVALTVSAAAEVLPVVSLDGTRIRQVLANLVENALTHTPDGGRVTVSVGNAASGMVRLVVEDTGAGIPQELLERIFDQFYRVDPSRSRGTGGAGLGLTIVKRLVEAHGGTVRAESTPGAGSRFIVEIPVSPSTADT
jgi:signal transduction histidine kinase